MAKNIIFAHPGQYIDSLTEFYGGAKVVPDEEQEPPTDEESDSQEAGLKNIDELESMILGTAAHNLRPYLI